jgi:hypothetical protein
LSDSIGNETQNFDRKQPEYLGGVQSRDMRVFDDKGYSEETEESEAQTQEDTDEGWSNQKTSPVVGKISGTMEELERIQSSEMTSDEVRECLKDSLDCYQTCSETIMRCLKMGGKHAEPEHINLLLDCAKICSTNADFILRNSTYYSQTCGITADICDECADTCDRFKEDFMKECAGACRRCAESCRELTR